VSCLRGAGVEVAERHAPVWEGHEHKWKIGARSALRLAAAEARLLAQPVSIEHGSSAHHEGIEDRITLAPLAGRRLAEQIDLGERIVAIELVLAAQAIDSRGRPRLGAGTSKAYARVRGLIPATGKGEPPPQDLEPVVELVRSGVLS